MAGYLIRIQKPQRDICERSLSGSFSLFFVFVFLFFYMVSKPAHAALCSDVFPANTTTNATPSQQLTYSYPLGQSFNNFNYLFANYVGAGDQYYNGRTMRSDIIVVTSGTTTRLFVNGNLTLDRGFLVEADVNEGGDPEDLILIVNGDLYISNKTSINALIYVEGDVTISGNPGITGAITATGSAPSPRSNQIYDADAVANAEFSTLCSTGGPAFDHFEISVPSNASTCSPLTVTFTAVDSGGAAVSDYAGTMTLTTSSNHGTWGVSSATNSVVDSTADDGSASYTFDPSDTGVVQLALTNTHADVLTITATDSSVPVSNVSSSVSFSDNAFEFVPFNNDLIAGRDHSFGVYYVKRDPSTGSCGVASDFSGSVNLKMSYSSSVNHPVGANAPSVSSVTLGTSPPVSNNIALNFVSGTSSFTLQTTDIGEYSIDLLDDSSGLAVDVSGSPLTISGSSAFYSVRPFGFKVTVPGNAAALDANGSIFIAAGELFDIQVSAVLYDSSDDVNADGIPDGHNDNDPGNNADLSNNSVTPSFGDEGETLVLNSALFSPVGGNDPGLNGTAAVTSFTSGVGTTGSNTYFAEVGIIEIDAALSDGAYLSSPNIPYGKSGHIGRFKPAYFTATANLPALTDGWYDSNADTINDWTCNFTYQGQNFAMDASPTMTLTAVNSFGVTTQNYTGAFNKFSVASTTQKNIQFVVEDMATTTASAPSVYSAVSITMADLGGGVIDFSINGLDDPSSGIYYNKTAQPSAGDEAFSADLSVRFFEELDNASPGPVLTVADPGDPSVSVILTNDLQSYFDDSAYLNTDNNSDGVGDIHQDLILQDADDVCYMVDTNSDGIPDSCEEYTLAGISGTEIRYGRLVIDNAYGSELLPLSLVYRAEYYDHITPSSSNSDFKVNDQDNYSLTPCTGTLVNSAAVSLSDFQLNLDAGETSAGSVSAMSDGLGSVVLTAPGSGNQGLVKVNITVPAWLEYDFDGDGSADQPNAVATFGVSSGEDLLFYHRENFR